MAYRYIGNKTPLVPRLINAITELLPAGGVVGDLMCGTASVAAGLRRAGYSVIASDLMTFAVHHARVRLLLARAPRFARLGLGGYLGVLRELQALEPVDGLFVREYSVGGCPTAGCRPRMYFTTENAAHIDAIRGRLAEWEAGQMVSERESSLLRHDLIMAVNDIANIAGTYGHYRSSWSTSALRPLRLTPSQFERGKSVRHTVLHGAAEEVAQVVSADLCYLDPPYMKRQYAANYHLIETLARGDEPETLGVSGLRDWWDQYSAFCSKRQIRDAFSTILGKMDCPYFLISYSEDGLLSIDDLVTFFQSFGAVSTRELIHKRFRSNDSPLGSTVTEYLVSVEVHR